MKKIRAMRTGAYVFGALLFALAFMPLDTTIAQSHTARVLQELDLEIGRGKGLHQHNADSALLVAKIQGRFGIYRFDFVTNSLELLELIRQTPLADSGAPEPFQLGFHTVGGVTFIVIRGKLYSSDGTRSGTQFIRDFGIHFVAGGALEQDNILDMHDMGGQLLFSVRGQDPFSGDFNRRLWVSDGSRQGTNRLGNPFAGIFTMFNVAGETFFFGEQNSADDLAIWQVSENGTRLSKVQTTAIKLSSNAPTRRELVVDRSTAYFCLDGVLTTFRNKNLLKVPAINCGQNSDFSKNTSGIFLAIKEEIFLLDTKTLSTTLIYKNEEPEDVTVRIQCSTSDSLIFTELRFGRLGRTSRLLSYSLDAGIQGHTFGINRTLQIESCLNDRVVVHVSEYLIYLVPDNRLNIIRNLSGFSQRFTSNFRENESPIFFKDKMYALDHLERARLLEISLADLDGFMIAPVITDLLLDEDAG